MKQLMVNLIAATVLGLPAPADAQSWDPLEALKPLNPLRIPDKPVEGPPERAEPEMAVYKPAGPGPFSAIVVQHGCGGISDHIGAWASQLVKAGYVALVLDSLTQRNVRNNCPPFAVPTPNGTLDAYHALEHLAKQPYVHKDRIGMLGASWGGMNALFAARKDIAERLPRGDKALRFRAIVSVYPHCFIPNFPLPRGRTDLEWLSVDSTDRPLLVLMGAADEETPAKFCLPRLEALRAKGANVVWHIFPDATHSWDNRAVSGNTVPKTAFGGVYTPVFNGQVTQEAHARALEFFARELGTRP